jgi:hypothetical protein
MKNALNIPKNPEQLRQVINQFETTGLQRERRVEAAKVLSIIDQDPEEHKDLLIVTAETLREEISATIASGNIGRFTAGFYADLANYIKISELLKDGINAWELVREVTDFHLDFYDGIKSSDFVAMDSELIVRIVNILRVFNRQIPGINEAIEMQAEAELLYANYSRANLEKNLKKDVLKGEAKDIGIEKVRSDFETALTTVLIRMFDADEDKTEAFALLEDIAVSYGDWLIDIGEKESAKELCEEIYMRNPNTQIYENLGFLHPREESLRKRATKNALKPADMQMDAFTRRAKAEGLQLETLLHMYEGRVIAAAKTLEVLAEADTEIAQQTSRSISGGHPLFKDPYHR